MAIDNEMYSRIDYGWWDGDDNSTTVFLHYFINPIRFAYFLDILKHKSSGVISGRRLLDVGCGGGYVCEEFSKTGFEVTGIDLSQNTLKAARSHAAQSRLQIESEYGKAEAIPFGDATFDNVCCCDVLEHVESVNGTISEIARVLKPGGLFFFDTINRTLASWLVMIKIAQAWKRSAW
jgi:2-polyprenyl-6-hydroxyphenyl methylase / 3-demethylubiquinone-9 3-methyltransferase